MTRATTIERQASFIPTSILDYILISTIVPDLHPVLIITITMKAKELKILRKKIDKADRLPNPLEALVERSLANDAYSLTKQNEDDENNRPNSLYQLLPNNFDNTNRTKFSIQWANSHKDIPLLFPQTVSLFEANMASLYEASSWGLDLEAKTEELQHRKARFLVVTTSNNNDNNENDTPTLPQEEAQQQQQLAAFCHYRFDYDDDQYPSCAALYLYEIQVAAAHQSHRLGHALMDTLQHIARDAGMPKVMLTVFKANTRAMGFYRHKLGYEIDEISPSQNDDFADYEILSKDVLAK